MAKLTLEELRFEIAGIIEEAKKKNKKKGELKDDETKKLPYGFYDEAFDFSTPQGERNHYARQGGVNWGPYTSSGVSIDSSYHTPNNNISRLKESEEQALRALVREVIENGLIPEDSAWAPLLEKPSVNENPWVAADSLFNEWYNKKNENEGGNIPGKPKGFEKTKFGQVQKHGAKNKKES